MRDSDFGGSSELERFAYLQSADWCLMPVLPLHSTVRSLGSYLRLSGLVTVYFAAAVAGKMGLQQFVRYSLCSIGVDEKTIGSLSFAKASATAGSAAVKVPYSQKK